MNKQQKGFTLIELIVVMAVIGILVLLGMPKFMGYTKEARFTKLISNTKQLENASERYYMDHQIWPRLGDEPYTAEEIKAFAEKIYDATGKVANLDPEGSYYDIDYDVLSKYINIPDDKTYYVIQNPVGNVYSLENLTEKAKTRLPDENKKPDETPEPIEDYSEYTSPVISTSADQFTSRTNKFKDNLIYSTESYIYGINNDNTVTILKHNGNLSSVVLPDKINDLFVTGLDVLTANQNIFSNKVNEITISKKISNVGNVRFLGDAIRNIDVDDNNLTYSDIDGVLFSKDKQTLVRFPRLKTENYVIPDGVTTIADNAFYLGGLKTVVIPDGVTTIGKGAFRSNNFKTINIPNTVKTIDSYAFLNNILSSVYIPNSVEFIGSNAFNANRVSNITASIDNNQNNIVVTSWAFGYLVAGDPEGGNYTTKGVTPKYLR